MSRTVFILGAGPCGLGLAYDLSRGGTRVVLIEAESEVGGLARTFEWGKSAADLGPHKLFSLDAALVEKVRSILSADAWLTHPKRSAIYLRGHFLKYPPGPVELVQALGPAQCLRGAAGLLTSRLGAHGRPQALPDTFENDAIGRVGRTFYRELFRPIAWKVWGDPATLDGDLSRSRIQLPSIRGVWQAQSYFYPRGGLRRLWRTMAETVVRQGGEIVLNDPVERLETAPARRVTGLATTGGRRWTLDPAADWVVSTIPLSGLARAMAVPAPVAERIARLRFNDLSLVFLKVREDVMRGNAWIFAPDPEVLFHRLSAQSAFDPGMVEPGVQLLCAEVMHVPGREAAALDDEAGIIGRCVDGLLQMGRLKSAAPVIDQRLIRLRSSYPVFSAGYRKPLKEVLAYFDAFENFRTIGRQGSNNYIGSFDALDTGFGTARLLIAGAPGRQEWTAERVRTSAYPILD